MSLLIVEGRKRSNLREIKVSILLYYPCNVSKCFLISGFKFITTFMTILILDFWFWITLKGIPCILSKLGDTTPVFPRFPLTKPGFPFSPQAICKCTIKIPNLVGKNNNKLNNGICTGEDSKPNFKWKKKITRSLSTFGFISWKSLITTNAR